MHRHGGLPAVCEALQCRVSVRTSRISEPQRRVTGARARRHVSDPDLATRLHQRLARTVVLPNPEVAGARACQRHRRHGHRCVEGAARVARRPPDRRGCEQRRVARRLLADSNLAEERRPAALAMLLVDQPETIDRPVGRRVDVPHFEEPAVLVAAAARAGDVDPRMPRLAERRPLCADVVAGREHLSRRRREVHVIRVAGCASRHVDGEVAGSAADADGRVRGLEEALRPAADPVAGVAEHRCERRGRSRRDGRPRERARRSRDHRDD